MSRPDAPVRAIAFDWGGIFTEGTFDSDAIVNLARLTGGSEQEIADVYLPLMARFEAGAFDIDEFVARFRKESGLDFETDAFLKTFLSSGRERPEMYEVLAAIPDSYKVAVLSNNVEKLCDRVRNDPRMARVERFLFSNELKVRKPEADAFARLSAALDMDPGSILFIDDSAANIEACRQLGFRGIHLRDFDQFLTEFTKAVPDVPLPLIDERA